MLQVQEAEEELKLVAAKRRHFQDVMLSIGAKMSSTAVHASNNASKTEIAAIGLWETTKLLEEKEHEYVAMIKKAEELIAKLKQKKFRQVLTYRYLCNWSWKSIRDQMDYKDEKSVYRCHGYALKELQKLL
jgi:hypothetical protein